MSLTGKLFTLSDANIATVIDDPTLLKQIVSPGEAPTGLLGQWFGGLRKPKKSAKQLHFGPGENESIYLDRAWHSLHYLFTGKVDAGGTPLDFLVEGGTLVEHPDILYVQARLFSAQQAAAIQAALALLDDTALRERYNPVDMHKQKIYSDESWNPIRDKEYCLDCLMQYLKELRHFLEAATRRKFGLVVYVM